VKVFDLAVGRTGVRDHEAESAGLAPFTVESRAPDRKRYYPGAQEIAIRVTGDRSTNRLLGAQLVGGLTAEVPKRLDIFAAALHHSSTVDGLNDLDLSYTPRFGSPWDAVQLAAQAWTGVEI
jgi:NADPH-dependent 2,4-dienoyl-CoA reductase/sulfur reductase-like enzyme